MAPDTVSLRYFLVLAQELNFTRAAARIGIAQPALSARIRRLETELGNALLVRDTRSVVLTTAGAALAESAPPALAALDRAWDTARRAGAGELGTLRIGYSLSAGAETAPALVDKLIRSSPGLEVGAVPMATPEISPAVADGHIDAGITRGEQPGRGVRRYLLRRARIGVQLAQHHPLILFRAPSRPPSRRRTPLPRTGAAHSAVRSPRSVAGLVPGAQAFEHPYDDRPGDLASGIRPSLCSGSVDSGEREGIVGPAGRYRCRRGPLPSPSALPAASRRPHTGRRTAVRQLSFRLASPRRRPHPVLRDVQPAQRRNSALITHHAQPGSPSAEALRLLASWGADAGRAGSDTSAPSA
ncbi:LysR family transcriptional regulator [Streptomyces sp. NPDC000345]|uniref:LysR family transcriptional regulator n=1 Tax=Streptomyces sp. NPDC000345 TaxID=3364537 RepID=UPI0036BD2BD2